MREKDIQQEQFKKLEFIKEKLEIQFPYMWRFCVYLDSPRKDGSLITQTGSSSISDNENWLNPIVDIVYGHFKIRQLFGRHENPFDRSQIENEFYFCKEKRTALDTFYIIASNLDKIPEISLIKFNSLCKEMLELHKNVEGNKNMITSDFSNL